MNDGAKSGQRTSDSAYKLAEIREEQQLPRLPHLRSFNYISPGPNATPSKNKQSEPINPNSETTFLLLFSTLVPLDKLCFCFSPSPSPSLDNYLSYNNGYFKGFARFTQGYSIPR